MHIKKLSATSCLAILGCSFSTASIALEEVIVNGPTIRNEPFISARLGGGGSGGGFGGNGAGFGGGAVNRIAEEERKRLEEEKKEKEAEGKESCLKQAAETFHSCDQKALTVFSHRIRGCVDQTLTIELFGRGSVGVDASRRDMNCVRNNEADREVQRAACRTRRISQENNC
ncbi:hypothetical protein [Agarilytica rhodophyticola]|uniref:hypothetical protein n=1 Tax=Agarilytica rhodophyticola TaxID=1737490 RepID=UPI000B346319|nr:hypothetical protein [Agarilytica rhodophyticola]